MSDGEPIAVDFKVCGFAVGCECDAVRNGDGNKNFREGELTRLETAGS